METDWKDSADMRTRHFSPPACGPLAAVGTSAGRGPIRQALSAQAQQFVHAVQPCERLQTGREPDHLQSLAALEGQAATADPVTADLIATLADATPRS